MLEPDDKGSDAAPARRWVVRGRTAGWVPVDPALDQMMLAARDEQDTR